MAGGCGEAQGPGPPVLALHSSAAMQASGSLAGAQLPGVRPPCRQARAARLVRCQQGSGAPHTLHDVGKKAAGALLGALAASTLVSGLPSG